MSSKGWVYLLVIALLILASKAINPKCERFNPSSLWGGVMHVYDIKINEHEQIERKFNFLAWS